MQKHTHTHTHKIEMATRRSALQRRGLYSGHFSHRTPKYWRSTGDAGDYNDTRTAESLSQKDFSIFSRVHKFLPNLWCRSLMRNQLARKKRIIFTQTYSLKQNCGSRSSFYTPCFSRAKTADMFILLEVKLLDQSPTSMTAGLTTDVSYYWQMHDPESPPTRALHLHAAGTEGKALRIGQE